MGYFVLCLSGNMGWIWKGAGAFLGRITNIIILYVHVYIRMFSSQENSN